MLSIPWQILRPAQKELHARTQHDALQTVGQSGAPTVFMGGRHGRPPFACDFFSNRSSRLPPSRNSLMIHTGLSSRHAPRKRTRLGCRMCERSETSWKKSCDGTHQLDKMHGNHGNAAQRVRNESEWQPARSSRSFQKHWSPAKLIKQACAQHCGTWPCKGEESSKDAPNQHFIARHGGGETHILIAANFQAELVIELDGLDGHLCSPPSALPHDSL